MPEAATTPTFDVGIKDRKTNAYINHALLDIPRDEVPDALAFFMAEQAKPDRADPDKVLSISLHVPGRCPTCGFDGLEEVADDCEGAK